ncbi:MAG: 1-(5-phosphoribosyl)-5-[(5-phosphoribosylamino)methylideneamino]imidazole-4-carboxamide isomerase [Nitrospinota bacterium]|nr:1-(5-phosphoribosyl)-5-[(5-phosphoribosylamino)methylideneamino]imidazole-4-carboxamide isomerase [Nitrospinota bacterium]
MIIYPAIDILDGKCVRLRQGDYDEVVQYSDDPVDMAYRWVDGGAKALHLVDLDGARAGFPINNDIIATISRTVGVPVQVGGGIRNVEAAAAYLDLGVDKVIFGTAAIENPLIIMAAADQYPGRIMVGLDIKSGKPATKGWLETAELNPIDLAKRFSEMGVAGIIYTDISRDGMLQGVNIQAVKHFADNVDLPIIVSGGVTNLDDVRDVMELVEHGVMGLIIGKALYAGELKLKDALDLARQ